MSKAKRLLAALAVSMTAAGALIGVTAAPAMANSTICAAYTNGQVWQTSAEWARVRERPCIEYTSTQVRAWGQFQMDWPYDCTVTVGLPPTGQIGCPSATLYKERQISLYGNKITYDFTFGDSTWYGLTCSFDDNAHGVYDAVSTGGTYTWTCTSGWVARGYSNYKVSLHDVMGDVKNDGDGWKVLSPVEWNFGAP